MEAVKSTCTGQATTLPKGGDYQIHLHRPSPHLAHGWRLSNLLAQAKPRPCPRVGTVISTSTGQAPTLPKGGDCQIHLHRPSPHLAQGWGLSTPLAQTKPPPCRRDCQFHLHKPSLHLAQGWGLSNPLAHTKPQPCQRVGTVKSTCKDQDPILPKGGDCQIHLHRSSPHLAQGWELSNPLAWAKPPPCQRVGAVKSTCTGQTPHCPWVATVKSTCTEQAPTLPKGGDCQIHLHRPSPHLAQGWELSNPLAQAKPPPCPRVGTVKSTCTGQPPTLPKGGKCQIHLHKPSPHLAQGWGLSNPMAQTKPPPCPRVGIVKSTCTSQAPTLPKGQDYQIHLHKASPHLAQGWGLSNPLARAKPPPCSRVGTVKSTCTGQAPIWPKGGECQIHMHSPSPHLAQGWGLSNPLAQANPPPCPRVGTVKSTCTHQAPILPKGGGCQIHLHGASHHLAQGGGLSIPLAHTKPPPCPWVATVKSTCTEQAPTMPKGGDCHIHLHRPSPHLAQGWGLSKPLAQVKPPPCPRVGTVNSTCPNQAPALPKRLSIPLAQAKPPSCPRVGTVKSTCTHQAPTLPEGGDCQVHLHTPSPHLAQGWGVSNPLAQAKPPPCPRVGTVNSTCPNQAPALPKRLSIPLAQAKPPSCPRVGTVQSTCTGQAPTLPKGGDCQVHLQRPSPHLAQGWGLSNPHAQPKPPPCPRVGIVKSTCTSQPPTLPKGGDCEIHLHTPSPQLAQGWRLSNPLARGKPPPCPRVGTIKSTCTDQAPTLPMGGDCQIYLHRPSPDHAQGWGLSYPLPQAKHPPCPRVGTVKSTCTGQAPTLPKGGDCQLHLPKPSPRLAEEIVNSTCTSQAPILPKGGDCQIHLHTPSPNLARGWGLSNPLAQTKTPSCPNVGTVKSTCTGQAPTLPKGGNCQIHLHGPSPHHARGWGLSYPLAQARPHIAHGWQMSNLLAQSKPPPCPRVGTVKSTCKGQAPILPKGGNCQIHLHKPSPHLAQGWGLSNPLAQANPPPCPRVENVKSTCTGQAPTLPKGGDCQVHLHRPSPHLAQGWGVSNPHARPKPPPCPRVGTVKSTCTSQPPTLPKGGDCEIHLHTPSPHLAQEWRLSNPLARGKPPPCPGVGTVNSTCTDQAPTLPMGGDCQIYLHRPSPHHAQGWGLSYPLAQAKPPPCPRVATVKSTCTGQAPTLPKGGDCQLHLPKPSPRLAEEIVHSTCTSQAPILPKGGDCQIHLHTPSPNLARGWGLSNPLAQTKPPSCPRVGTVKSTCTGQAPTLPKGGDCQLHLPKPSPHLAEEIVHSTCTSQAPILPKGGDCQIHLHTPSPNLAGEWGLSSPLAQAKPPSGTRVGTVKSTCTGQSPTLPKGGDCQLHLPKPSPRLAEEIVHSTCTSQAPILPKGGDCQIHLHTPSPNLARGWGLSNPLAQTKPPSCPRVGTVKSTCTGQAPTLAKGGDCQLHLPKPSPRLAEEIVHSTCTSQAPILPKGGDCQIHLHTPSPNLARGWGLSSPLAKAKPPSGPRVGTVKSTCTAHAPTLPKGGDCQIHLHKPTPHLAQGWGL